MAAERDAPASRYFELNRQFHLALIPPSGNHLLTP